MGHIGLTPQSVHGIGGYKVQGKTVETARGCSPTRSRSQEAGAFAVVLECVPADLAARYRAVADPDDRHRRRRRLRRPGAGDHDLLGLTYGFIPKHAKQYEHLAAQ